MAQLEGTWPDRVLLMQRNWIGRSEGAEVEFAIEGRDEPVTVFTTRPDTLYGATFFVVAADSPLAAELCAPEQRAALDGLPDRGAQADRHRAAVHRARRRPASSWAGTRSTRSTASGSRSGRPTTCCPTTAPARSWPCPRTTSATWTSPGPSGCRCGWSSTPASPIRRRPASRPPATARWSTPGRWTGWPRPTPSPRSPRSWQSAAQGRAAVNYRLRDWLVSRQRFWGTPIPIVYCASAARCPCPTTSCRSCCPTCAAQDLAPKGVSPLAAASDWVNTECPKCGGPAKRDTDTMDTFVDSSWYFLRYCSPHYEHGPFDVEAVRRWAPGRPVRRRRRARDPAPAVQHGSSPRCCTTCGCSTSPSRSPRLLNQGQVINHGKAMSKSLGNGVDLGEQLAEHGVDAIRLTMIFASPPEDDIDWADMRPEASVKFLGRVWRVAADVGADGRRPRRQRRATWSCARSRTGPSTRSPGWSRRPGSTWPSRG